MLTKIQDPVWIGQLNRFLGIKMALIIFSYLNFCVDFWRPFLAFQCKKMYGTYWYFLAAHYYKYMLKNSLMGISRWTGKMSPKCQQYLAAVLEEISRDLLYSILWTVSQDFVVQFMTACRSGTVHYR